MRGVALVVVVAVVGLAGLADGGVIAPSKPSQTVLLRPGAACPGGGLVLDTRIAPDGTTSAFTIPDKHVLVLDSVAWAIGDAVSPGNTCGMVVRVGATIAWSDVVLSDSFGTCGRSITLPNIAVQSGTTLCVGVGSGGVVNSFVTRAHGFLVKDK